MSPRKPLSDYACSVLAGISPMYVAPLGPMTASGLWVRLAHCWNLISCHTFIPDLSRKTCIPAVSTFFVACVITAWYQSSSPRPQIRAPSRQHLRLTTRRQSLSKTCLRLGETKGASRGGGRAHLENGAHCQGSRVGFHPGQGPAVSW